MPAAPGPIPDTLLVVDDDTLVREVLQALLEDAGHRVRSAANGAEAAAVLQQHGAEIRGVLLDMTLPGSTPDEVVAAIRAHAPQAPVLLASGRSAGDVGETVERLGCAGFLRKPFGADELLSALQKVLGTET